MQKNKGLLKKKLLIETICKISEIIKKRFSRRKGFKAEKMAKAAALFAWEDKYFDTDVTGA